MHIIEMTSEAVPFAKTGGLADVVGSLPKPMARAGNKVSLFMPLFRAARDKAKDLRDTKIRVQVRLAGETETGEIWTSKLPGTDVDVYFVGHKEFFDRDGLYGNAAGDFHDNSRRFIFFTRAVLEAAPSLSAPADVIHCHDWQTALAPVYVRTIYAKTLGRSKTVLTLHNLSFQGIFWHWDMNLAALPWELFDWKHLEFFGKMNFLKGGIVFADALTTVSPRYALEIQTAEFGCGLDGVLSERRDRLHGILNGIDEEVWSPERDANIPARYSVTDLSGKQVCKAHLQKRAGLPARDVPVFGMITRLTEQKGVDLVIGALPALLEDDVQVVILGSGDPKLQSQLAEAARRFAGKLTLTVAFDDRFAHEIEAGSDMFLMPSRFEPCGLNQMYSLRYGTVPIVRETGGLADTVVDCTEETLRRGTGTGFRFVPCTVEALLGAIHRALSVYRQPENWRRLRENGMKQNFGWDTSAAKYLQLFQRLTEA